MKNPMTEAWKLLKGNRTMRDAEGRAISHPAAMVYDDLASQVHLNEQNPFDPRIGNEDDESAADVMERMRSDRHSQRLARKFAATKGEGVNLLDMRMAARNDQAEKNRLNEYRRNAREYARNVMEFGNEDNTPSPNYGVQQSTGEDVRMLPKEEFPFQYE